MMLGEYAVNRMIRLTARGKCGVGAADCTPPIRNQPTKESTYWALADCSTSYHYSGRALHLMALASWLQRYVAGWSSE